MKTSQTSNALANLGEFGFIERIRQLAGSDSSIVLGIGDDCAATRLAEGALLLTSKDLLIEDVHFRRQWTDLYSLGRKSAAVNLSDIAAMGGTAHHLFLGVGVPASLSTEDLDHFCRGFLDECKAAGATLCGGDTCRSTDKLLISVTVQGSVSPQQLCRRSNGAAGHALYVSGTLGDSALALQQLQRGITPEATLALRHHQPTPRLQLGRLLAERGLVGAMIDISDGLFADLGHILDQSRLGACIDPRCLPFSAAVKSHLHQHPEDTDLVQQGGEDYELLFTVHPDQQPQIESLAQQLQLPLTRIGTMLGSQYGLNLLQEDGQLRRIPATGFNHFRQEAD